MSTFSATSGLGINLDSSTIRSSIVHGSTIVSPSETDIAQASSAPAFPSMRSISAMRGLLLAEVGDSMVEFDPCGAGSGFREGQRMLWRPQAVDQTHSFQIRTWNLSGGS